MVLPVLGILGLAAGSLAYPHMQNYSARTRGRYLERQAERRGIDLATAGPDELRTLGLGAGMLDAETALGDLRTAEEGALNRANALQRQRISSGPAYMNAQLARERFEYEVAEAERVRQERDLFQGWAIENFGTEGEQAITSNPFTPPSVRDSVTGGIVERLTAPVADMTADVQAYTVEQQRAVDGIASAQTALEALDTADANYWATPESAAARSFVNQILVRQRMDYWNNTLGRSDAPSEAEVAMLESMFPTVDRNWNPGRDAQMDAIVRQNLQRYIARQRRLVEDRAGAAIERGLPVPAIEPRVDLPAGWAPVQ